MTRRPDRRDRSGAGGIGRRAVLASLATGAVGAVAGCVNAEPSDDDGEESGWSTSVGGDLSSLRLFAPAGPHAAVAFAVGFVRDAGGERRDVLAERVEATDERVELALREGLSWSNGDPLTTAGFGQWLTMLRASSTDLHPVPAIRDGRRTPRTPLEGITGIEWSDRSIRVTGRFEGTEGPLRFVNTYVGSRPRAYYEPLWTAVQSQFDDEPWEDEAARASIRETVAGNLWDVPRDWLPNGGLRLAGHDESGAEAAYSGLWYPHRITNGQLHFRRNDAHPFADRVDLEELTWTFREGAQSVWTDVRSGAVDGAMRADFPREIHDALPESMVSIRGTPSRVTALAFNHEADHLADRDVRAALAHVIDRGSVAESLGSFSTEPIAVPGADLQRPEWAPPAFRESLRTYDRDLDRAVDLLERAGWSREDGRWYTAAGEEPAVTILTDDPDPTLVAELATPLEEFGIDAGFESSERTTYQTRLDDGTFFATVADQFCPNPAGRPWTRAGEYVADVHQGDGFPVSAFLADAVTEAVEREGGLRWQVESEPPPLRFRRLEYDSVETLRAVTVRAPPLGEPSGSLREWPYLYHAVRARSAATTDEAIEHARVCTWCYNYLVPQLELTVDVPRIVHETEGWSLPDPDDEEWQRVGTTTRPGGLWWALARGAIDTA